MSTNTPVTLLAPLQTAEAFGAACGVSTKAVMHWMDKGQVPVVRIGTRRLVNVFSLCQAGFQGGVAAQPRATARGASGGQPPSTPLGNHGGNDSVAARGVTP